MSNRQKGNRIRNIAIKELTLNGWKAGIVERTGRFVKEKDLFDMFDLCAIKTTDLSLPFSAGGIRFIQVKTNTTGGFIKKLEEFRNKFNINATFELWVWYDRKGFTKYER